MNLQLMLKKLWSWLLLPMASVLLYHLDTTNIILKSHPEPCIPHFGSYTRTDGRHGKIHGY